MPDFPEEAVEALGRVRWGTGPGGWDDQPESDAKEAGRSNLREELEAFLPIERERWEREVRERLTAPDVIVKLLTGASRTAPSLSREYRDLKKTLNAALDSIFEEGDDRR